MEELAAGYDLSGGQIKTAVLNAAFAAVQEGRVTMAHLKQAAAGAVSTFHPSPIGFLSPSVQA